MTYRYYLVRRAIYEKDPTSKLKKCRNLKDMKRLFKLPYWIMNFFSYVFFNIYCFNFNIEIK